MPHLAERNHVNQRRPASISRRPQSAAAQSPPTATQLQARDGAPVAARVTSPVSVRVNAGPATKSSNGGGLPPRLREGVEALSGIEMSDVRVHRNSPEPVKLGAAAFTRGTEIHLGPGEDENLAHEAWHVVQQKQGRVQASTQMKGAAINNDAGLESEADLMGARATETRSGGLAPAQSVNSPEGAVVVQRRPKRSSQMGATISVRWSEDERIFYDRVVAALSRSRSFRGIDADKYNSASATEHFLRDHVQAFRDKYHEFFGRRPKRGETVKLRVSAYYSARDDAVIDKKVSYVLDASAAKKLQEKASEVAAAQTDPATTSNDPRAAEAERGAHEMWGILNGLDNLGAEVEFTYFTSKGAMTLVSYRQAKPGQEGGATPVSLKEFKRDTLGFVSGAAAGSTLVHYVGEGDPHYLSFTLERQAAKWSRTKFTNVPTASTPPEGREDPNTSQPGLSVDASSRVSTSVAKWLPIMQAPFGGSSTISFTASFDDDRLTALDFIEQTRSGTGSATAPAAPSTDTRLDNALRAFAQGLGQRKIKLSLFGEEKNGKTQWRVLEAATQRAPGPRLPDEAEAIIEDYRRTHAEVMRLWKEGVKDAGIYAAKLGAQELAWLMIGGVIGKGAGAIFERAAPKLLKFIRLGSKNKSRAGAEFFDSMITRLPAAERAEIRSLQIKVETEGIKALNSAERKSYDGLLKKIENLIESPLTPDEKDWLRAAMDKRYLASKSSADAAFQAARRKYEIHHRMPLEFAHKFPGADPNTGANLIGLETTVHRGVNAVWTRLRTSAPAAKVTDKTVSKVMDIIDRHFKKWYDVPPKSSGNALLKEVQAAKDAARAEVDKLVSSL